MESSAFLLDLLQRNNIPGCLILLREEENGDLAISHAEDNIHEINITQCLATIILEKNREKDNRFSTIIMNSAHSIATACEMIKDLTQGENS